MKTLITILMTISFSFSQSFQDQKFEIEKQITLVKEECKRIDTSITIESHKFVKKKCGDQLLKLKKDLNEITQSIVIDSLKQLPYNNNLQKSGAQLKSSAVLTYASIGISMGGTAIMLVISPPVGALVSFVGLAVGLIAPSKVYQAGELLENVSGIGNQPDCKTEKENDINSKPETNVEENIIEEEPEIKVEEPNDSALVPTEPKDSISE